MASAAEDDRLSALLRYDILDTPSEESFDRITRLTRRMLDVPMSTLTFVDGHRQWFKSRSGVSACETTRDVSLCSVAIEEDRALVVPDTLLDPRFSSNPLVTGKPGIRFYAGATLRTPGGHALGTLCGMDVVPRECTEDMTESLCDLAAVVMNVLELRSIASVDSLTGVLSRRALREAYCRARAEAAKTGGPNAFVMIDLDHFKAVNDRHGHGIGDVVLAAAADACRRELAPGQSIGRLGGEEFAVLLPGMGHDEALAVAERLRQAVASLRIAAGGTDLSVTASLGVACTHGRDASFDTMMARADDALYSAKSAGRNRSVGWEMHEADYILEVA